MEEPSRSLLRNTTIDATTFGPRSLLLPVNSTLGYLLSREDTDHNFQITIDDSGPKNLSVATVSSHGFRHIDVRGTYMLSNLLQELTLAQGFGHKNIIMDEARLTENPFERLSRLIKNSFWSSLTRRLDGSSIDKAATDPKDWTPHPQPRIYVLASCLDQIRYYQQIAHFRPDLMLDVQILQPRDCTPDGIRDLNAAPGILALDMETYSDESTGITKTRGLQFVVPGGRFNELYGWDSYIESIGLIIDDRVDLAEAMVKHFCFCIKHYGKILNANRSYYLGRSQPPFLTDMALRVYEKKRYETGGENALGFLREAIYAAIKEYYTIWMAEPRLDLETGLSRYRPVGVGIPPETEATHFIHVVKPFAEKHGMDYDEFVTAYNNELVQEPQLDEYFLHDRAVRESGHDTSYRLEKVAANLATIDLNALLYKYETDIARTINVFFGGSLYLPSDYCVDRTSLQAGQHEKAEIWYQRAEFRRSAVDRYLWNEDKGMYFDYDTVKKLPTEYESATTFWSLWAGLATPHQAEALVQKALPKLEVFGGLVSGTEESRGPISLSRPSRQWDYPFGWAPHQILAWIGKHLPLPVFDIMSSPNSSYC